MFPDLYSETDKNEIKFLLGFYLLLKKMTLFSSDLKLHLLHYFQQQILSEYFNVICKTKRLYFFFLFRYRGSKKKSRYFSIWYTVTEYCFDNFLEFPQYKIITN